MARIAAEDGVRVMACTPHILPGLYENDAAGIQVRVAALRQALADEGIELTLVVGADVHVAPDLPEKLKAGRVPTLNGSRYFLLEPPHEIVPPNFETLVRRVIEKGYVPILTHPERLGWASSHYDIIDSVNRAGCLVQITAGSLTGSFGRRAQEMADRMLEEGRVDIIASDAHNVQGRIPGLSRARAIVVERYGQKMADDLVAFKPALVLQDQTVTTALSARTLKAVPARKSRTRSVRLSRFVEWIKNA